MTTKPKPRKAAAAKARHALVGNSASAGVTKGATKQAAGDPKREVSGIRRFISRWHWPEADQTHRANLAQTNKESERLIAIHNDEQRDIEGMLAQTVPESFSDACYLLEFVTRMLEGCIAEGSEIAMLKNVREGLRLAWNNDMQAERKKATAEFCDDLGALLEIFHQPRHLRTLLDTLNRADKIKTVDDCRAA